MLNCKETITFNLLENFLESCECSLYVKMINNIPNLSFETFDELIYVFFCKVNASHNYAYYVFDILSSLHKKIPW